MIGIAVDRFVLSRPTADVEAYHEQVREAAAGVPFHFDRWLGVEAPVPQGAITMLKPNAIISRTYREMGRGRSATFLMVHCRDARDILGHYPPVCYVNQGWAMRSATPQEHFVDGREIVSTRYVFSVERDGLNRELIVDNFMVMPNGLTARDMDEVERAAQDTRLKHYGAGQFQIVYDSSISESDRTKIFDAMIRPSLPLILTIQQSVGKAQE